MKINDYFTSEDWELLSDDQRASVVVYLRLMGHYVIDEWAVLDYEYFESHEEYIAIASSWFGDTCPMFTENRPTGKQMTYSDLLIMAGLGMQDEGK